MSDNKGLLRRVTILQELSDKDLDNLSQRLVPRTYVKEAIIVSQEEEGDSLFIIKSGKVKVTLFGDSGREVILSIFKPGDYFGEIGLLTEARRNASIRAKSDLELLAMSWDDFRKVIESSEASRKDFADIMRERLAQT